MCFKPFVVRILLVALFSVPAYSQELLPFVENFTKSDYNGDNQIWNVVQGNDNVMYFANNRYFLRYNGVIWEKYSLPNKTVIRSVFVDGDRVYCGSYKEFGYWKRVRGRMVYHSLSKNKNLFLGNADNEEIWKVFKNQGKIYFQSFNEIYIYDGAAIEKIKFPSQISYCYVVDGRIYVASVRNGIYIMKGKDFIAAENWPELKENVIHGMEQHDGNIYIFTKNNGVYIDRDGHLEQWKNTLNNSLKDEVIVTARFIGSHTLAIGTGLQGLYIINLQTGDYKNINRKNRLKNNAVLSLALDKENDLWLGLDNGISHIEINSPVTIFSDDSGVLGSVYSLSTVNDGYLFVTNHGIFSHRKGQLKAIPGSQGQVWDIYKNGNNFIIGHNDGTFVYDGASLRRVNPVNGGWKFLKSTYDNVYFQANYSGIAVYKNINDLSKWEILDSITKPIRNIAQTSLENYGPLITTEACTGFCMTGILMSLRLRIYLQLII
jgi:AraC family chitin signaling transcriptional activator